MYAKLLFAAVAVLVCVSVLEAGTTGSVYVSPRCPGRVKAGRLVYLGAVGSYNVQTSGASVSWSACDNEGHCNRGSDYASRGRNRRNVNMYFAVSYRRRGTKTITARLSVGPKTGIGRCTFVVV